jgi:hypothetical protein
MIMAIMPMMVWNLPNHLATLSKLFPTAGARAHLRYSCSSWGTEML